MKINDIDMQFSKDDTNRDHYNLPSFAKPQIQSTDEKSTEKASQQY